MASSTADLLAALAARDEWDTLPPGVFCSDEIFALEAQRIFRPGWLNIGHVSMVPDPGDFRAVDLLGEQLVLTRDRGGELHVLSRVCTHRWMDVCEPVGCGNAPSLQCPYHRWTFSLDGTLRAAPEMDDTPDFDKDAFGLHEFRHEVWEGFVFVNLDGDAPSTADLWGPMSDQLAAYGLADWVIVESKDWGVSAWDWKVFVDNGECYHHLGAHADTLEGVLPARRVEDLADNGEYTLIYARAEPDVLDTADDGNRDFPSEDPAVAGLDDRQRTALGLAYPFPNYALALMPQSAFWYEVRPLGAGRLHLVAHVLLPPHLIGAPGHDERVAEHAAMFEAIHLEDIPMCEGVQRGVAAGAARGGRLSHLEGHNRGFARWYARQMTSDRA